MYCCNLHHYIHMFYKVTLLKCYNYYNVIKHYNNTISRLNEELNELVVEKDNIESTIKNKSQLEKDAAQIQDDINNKIEELELQLGGIIMDKLEMLKCRIQKFNDDRDWNKFHTPSNLAKSVVKLS